MRGSVVVAGVVRLGAGALSSSLVVVVPASLPKLVDCANALPLAVARIKAINKGLRIQAVRRGQGNLNYSVIS